MTSRTTRAALALAGAGAIVLMLSPFGTVGDVLGLIAIVLGTVLAAPAAREPRGGWWGLLASGAVLSALGAIVSLANDTAGGVLALIGGVAVLIGVALGWPA
jgi:hypothetical protein